jgi:uncharacterized protein YjeT (DUF2065 family)
MIGYLAIGLVLAIAGLLFIALVAAARRLRRKPR